MPYFNARLLLILVTAASIISIFWYMASSSPVARQGLTVMDDQRADDDWRFRLAPQEGAATDDASYAGGLFKERLVHLDFKGARPSMSYVEQLLPLLKQLGATGLLIEYEDTFPYSGPLAAVAAGNAFSRQDVVRINQLAKENQLEIVPLVQTFGHLEFVLKLAEFRDLREVPNIPVVVCPSQNRTLDVLHQMLSQVAELHPASKRLHIGADEVYGDLIGRCSLCQQRLEARDWSTTDLFLDHVTAVAQLVGRRLGLRPLMWDDEFRNVADAELHRSGVGRLVDVVVWNYGPTLQLPIETWDKYLDVFDSVWVASAFKGATGSDQVMPDVSYHAQNHLAWMALVGRYRGTPHADKFVGLALTGWSRYDHFAILCELLPVGLPSLAYNLQLVQQGYRPASVRYEAGRLLQCPDDRFAGAGVGVSFPADGCQFPGAGVWSAVNYFVQVRDDYRHLMNNSVVRGWLNEFNVRHDFSSPVHLRGLVVDVARLSRTVEAAGVECRTALQGVFDHFTAGEWVETHVQPIAAALERLQAAVESLGAASVWPRRPLNNDNES